MTQLVLAGVASIDPDRVKPGWLGLVVVLAIAVATVLLWRSMNKQFRKIRFDRSDDESQDRSDDEAGSADEPWSDESRDRGQR